jgi:hypothetical protein
MGLAGVSVELWSLFYVCLQEYVYKCRSKQQSSNMDMEIVEIHILMAGSTEYLQLYGH